MNNEQKVSFKNQLKQFCKSVIEQRLLATDAAIQRAQEAANNEEKSSAGDKYETSRAMNHLEKDMHAKQQAEIVKELAILHTVNVNKICNVGEPGAIVKSAGICFFIAAGVGRHRINEQQFYFLSPHAPLAKQLCTKKAGDTFLFNRVEMRIEDVY